MMYGVQDGAPDDQLNPERGPDAWHVVGVVVGPDEKQLHEFCKAIEANAGHPKFALRKWNAGSKDHRLPSQLSFARGFTAALRLFENIHVYAYAMQAKSIRSLWDTYKNQAQRIHPYVMENRADGKQTVRWNPVPINVNGSPQLLSVGMDFKRAAVLNWTAVALAELYQVAAKRIGHKPRWRLLCDQLPGDPRGNGFAVVVKILSTIAKDRIIIQVPAANPKRADIKEELLADCVATWAKDFLEHPERPTATALQRIFDDPELTKRFTLSGFTGVTPP